MLITANGQEVNVVSAPDCDDDDDKDYITTFRHNSCSHSVRPSGQCER